MSEFLRVVPVIIRIEKKEMDPRLMDTAPRVSITFSPDPIVHYQLSGTKILAWRMKVVKSRANKSRPTICPHQTCGVTTGHG